MASPYDLSNLKDYSRPEEEAGKTLSLEKFRQIVKDTNLSPKEVRDSAKAKGIKIENEDMIQEARSKVRYEQEKKAFRQLEAERAGIPGVQKFMVKHIANPLRKRLGIDTLDPEKTLREQGAKTFSDVALNDLGFAPDVMAGAAQAFASTPTDLVGTIVGLFNKQKGEEISDTGDITPFLEENGLADTGFFNTGKMATDLGISIAATKAILQGANSVKAIKRFSETYPGWTKWLTKPVAEGVVGTQAFSVASEGEAATATETAIGAGASVVLNGLIQGYIGLKGSKITPKKAAAQITGQSRSVKAGDLPKILDSIQDEALNTDDILTYQQLANRTDEAATTIAKAQDDYLSQFSNTYATDDLVVTVKEGSTSVDDNFVTRALNELDELADKGHSKTNPKILRAKVTAWKDKLNSGNMYLKDINDLAKDYSKNISGFSDATGRPLTSVTAQQAETTRKGIKSTLRGLLPDDTSRMLDTRYSNMVKLKSAADDMKEKVFNLWRKTNETTMGDKLADAMDAADKKTGGVFGAFRSKFGIPSGRGKKIKNALGLEEVLNRNLRVVRAMSESLNPRQSKSAIKKVVSDLVEEFGKEDVYDFIRIIISSKTADILGDNK